MFACTGAAVAVGQEIAGGETGVQSAVALLPLTSIDNSIGLLFNAVLVVGGKVRWPC